LNLENFFQFYDINVKKCMELTLWDTRYIHGSNQNYLQVNGKFCLTWIAKEGYL
jgi:hypothetical protein